MPLPNYYSTPEQRTILDDYTQACEELDRITAQMAYHVGVKQGKKDAV